MSGVLFAASAATLEERVSALETRDAELYHTLEEKKAAGLLSKLTDRLSLSGLVDVEAHWENLHVKGQDDEAASDLALATAQLGLEAIVTPEVSATVLFLFEEEGADAVGVDEAYVDYRRGGWSARFGRQYVPFGEFPGHFISDPLTLELGETRETAVRVGYEHDLFSLTAFVFNGDAEKVNGAGDPEEDHIKDWGVSAKVMPIDFLECGASILSDLADTDAELIREYVDRVPGWSAFALVRLRPVEATGEVLGSINSFDDADLDADADGSGDRPFAWNVEIAWDLLENLELAGRIAGSRQLGGSPKWQYGLAASWGPWESVSLSLEYLRSEFRDGFGLDEDGRELQSRDLVTTQLAVEF